MVLTAPNLGTSAARHRSSGEDHRCHGTTIRPEYIVTIATDEGLANVVAGSATAPLKTDGSVFALPSTLSEGTYYWAITPVDRVS